MGSVMHGLTDAVGLTDYAGQEAAQEAANAHAAAGLKMSKEQLEFMKTKYNDWNKVFGYQGVAKDLGSYFKNLTGDAHASNQLVQMQKAEQVANEQIAQQMAQRGLTNSGLEMSLLNANTFNSEQAQAQVKASKDEWAMQQKMGFLGLGLGQGSSYLGAVGNAGNTAIGSQMNWAGVKQGQASNLAASNQAFTQGLVADVASMGMMGII